MACYARRLVRRLISSDSSRWEYLFLLLTGLAVTQPPLSQFHSRCFIPHEHSQFYPMIITGGPFRVSLHIWYSWRRCKSGDQGRTSNWHSAEVGTSCTGVAPRKMRDWPIQVLCTARKCKGGQKPTCPDNSLDRAKGDGGQRYGSCSLRDTLIEAFSITMQHWFFRYPHEEKDTIEIRKGRCTPIGCSCR